MSDVENTAGDSFAPEEKAYFESRGETDAPAAVEEPVTETVDEALAEPAAAIEEVAEQKDKTVPHGAFHEERERRKKAEEKTRALELENATAKGRLEALLQGNAPKQDEQRAAPPSVEDDIFGAVSHQSKDIAEVKAEIDAYKKQEAQKEAVRNVLTAAANAEREFSAEKPDYPDAIMYLRQSRVKELQVFGMTEEQARQRVNNEEIQLAGQALQRGRNPAEMVYQWATERGYAKRAPAPAPVDPATKLKAIEDGQAANKSLSATGGGASAGSVGVDQLLAMSDKEFEVFRNSNPAKFRKIMAGAS